MELNAFIAQIAIIFVPGLIWARLDVRYGSKTAPSEVEFFLRAFVFGLASYLAVFLLYRFKGWGFDLIDVASAEERTVLSGNLFDEVAFAFLISLVLATLWLYAVNRKWLTRLLQRIGATNTYGDEDVWDFTFNSAERRVTYVNIRDFNKNLTYSGYVNTFSSSGKLRELVLSDVKIYDDAGLLLLETPLIYLARPQDDLHIEFPSTQS
ncbi:MAG: DUF6338 family protein [Brevundimonas sp.]